MPAVCRTRRRRRAGPIVFEIENAGTSKVSEFEVLDGEKILGEKENLAEGLSGSFTLSLDPGRIHALLPRWRGRARHPDDRRAGEQGRD